jgi:hypothetical protein
MLYSLGRWNANYVLNKNDNGYTGQSFVDKIRKILNCSV